MKKRFIARSFWVFDSEFDFSEIKSLESPKRAKEVADILNEAYLSNGEDGVLSKLIELRLININGDDYYE